MDQTLPGNCPPALYFVNYLVTLNLDIINCLLTVFTCLTISSLRTFHHQMTSLSVRPWEIPLRSGLGTLQAFPVTLSQSTMVSLSVIHVDGKSVELKSFVNS